ncbi:3-hydroxyacyl-CoA dehydrogenase NAD-binding domain-containing protein [Agrobacterium larrymoorei]|uniref:3-hydroxyacyl-CoA dehydrogenase NAD-binding domain-containing protein n=1 Tax=Agrobacterium larrymoorei TaxID=160699 RepID=A0AAF0HBK8_9HYPH|nr:3-hydroxyacyl-CoA dehydrogenase NAD-binding domain-containing protein [Agrobacterium larrymoorei]WHA44104.1 3-hydroxyacyl-CoA dehydrogenase NAD-binding domain-containing protein [Agrobacterium larrymoorei]
MQTETSRSGEVSRVRIERDGDIAFIAIDNPPINAGSIEVRRGLLDALAMLQADNSVSATVLIGAGKTFVAGSDLREFSVPLADPQVPAVIAALEQFPKPVIAALHGAALGGGFELALGCDARIATVDAVVGLPEVTFGIIPGAGGTVRLPRLTDAATAIDIITSCRRIKAPEALVLGLVDGIANDLRKDAAALARSLRGKRRVRDMRVVAFTEDALEEAASNARRKRRGHPGVEEAIAAIRRAVSMDFDAALAEERGVFQRLRMTDESAALRHLFFAERRAGNIDDAKDVPVRDLKTIGIVGAGTMGAGIAACFLSAGYKVRLVDQNTEALASLPERLTTMLTTPSVQELIAPRFSTSADVATFADCDMVVEAVFENMEVKRALIGSLNSVVADDAIIASNTSYLNLDLLAEAATNPANVVGLHFFSPAHRMKLLEIVRGKKTSVTVLKTALAVGRKLGKTSVVSGVGEGFIGNRIYNAYRLQCELMVDQGAEPQQVDRALEAFGFVMGPFAVGDLSGLDIAAANRKRRRDEGIDPHDATSFLERLVLRGRLGRKTSAGWYDYPDGARRGVESSDVAAMLNKWRNDCGAMQRQFTEADIQKRALAAIVNEAALVLQEGIAARASDIDLVWVNGYGFPARLGGPLHWFQGRSKEWISSAMQCLEENPQLGYREGVLETILNTSEG